MSGEIHIETDKYLRSKLSTYKKEEIIDALFRKYSFSEIDLIISSCQYARAIRQMEEESHRFERETKTLQEAIAEYNAIVREVKEKGLENIPIQKVKRMSALLKIIEKAGSGR